MAKCLIVPVLTKAEMCKWHEARDVVSDGPCLRSVGVKDKHTKGIAQLILPHKANNCPILLASHNWEALIVGALDNLANRLQGHARGVHEHNVLLHHVCDCHQLGQ